jgi:hypothetical protein
LSVSAASSYHHIDSVSSLQKELKECISEVEQIEEARATTTTAVRKEVV